MNEKEIQELIDTGADVNLRNEYKQSPLSIAASNGNNSYLPFLAVQIPSQILFTAH